MASITDCDSLPERNQVAPQGESTQQLFPYNGIPINTLVMCLYRRDNKLKCVNILEHEADFLSVSVLVF